LSPAGTDTRGELLAAARRVIRRAGFAGVTVGDITREAGASLGLLNYHFGSKDQVLAEAFDEIARSELAEMEAIVRRPDPPAERLVACLDVSDWGDRASWTLWLDAWGASGRVEALRVTLGFYADGWRACLARVLDDGVRDGSWACEDPAQSASLIVAMIDGIGLQAMLHPDEVTPGRATAWARRIVEAELGIALPRSGAARGAEPGAPSAPFELRLAIRGRDLDAGGAVHPAAQLAYLEEARRGWLTGRLGRAPAELGRVAIDFCSPLREEAGEVVVRCALRRAGRASVVTEETITTAAGDVVARAEATLVLEGDGGRPRLLEAREREALAR
jgi:AcrR family transcriptional regulator/acyl-CoA thioesterase FadM